MPIVYAYPISDINVSQLVPQNGSTIYDVINDGYILGSGVTDDTDFAYTNINSGAAGQTLGLGLSINSSTVGWSTLIGSTINSVKITSRHGRSAAGDDIYSITYLIKNDVTGFGTTLAGTTDITGNNGSFQINTYQSGSTFTLGSTHTNGSNWTSDTYLQIDVSYSGNMGADGLRAYISSVEIEIDYTPPIVLKTHSVDASIINVRTKTHGVEALVVKEPIHLRPSAVASNSGWTDQSGSTTDLHTRINQTGPNDSVYIKGTG